MKINPNIHTRPGNNLARFKLLLAALAASAITATQAQVPVFTNIWNLSAGNFTGLPANAGNNCRGIGVNPVTTNVLYFSSTGGTNNGNSHVGTLAFANGSNYLANLNGTNISGGTVGTEGVRVSDDGFVYGINLSGAPASTFKIYRWPSDTDVVTEPTIVYSNAPGSSFQWRAGDYSDLRGSGINTEIVVVGNGSGANITTNFLIFRPTDAYATNFTNFSITIPVGLLNVCGAGVAFEGTNNAIWVRRAASQETRRITYDPVLLTATVTRTNTVDQTVCQGLKYFSGNGVEMLATVQAASGLGSIQRARVFTIPASPTGPLVSVLSSNLPVVPTSNNGNGLGNVDVRKGYLAFGTPGHGISLFKLSFVTNAPPSSIVSASANTLIEGFGVTFTATASGTAPLSYQWYFNTNTLIPGATLSTYTIASTLVANAGAYNVIVTNAFGSFTSSFVNISVLPKGYSTVATQVWAVAAGARDYVSNDNNQRGMGYDPINNQVVLVSRTPTNGVHLLNATTGADQGEMDVSLIFAGTPPGTFPINVCGVAADGVLYVANLITSGASDTFAIYSWNGATNGAAFGLAYFANPGFGRLGDTMAVRGSGVNTEILCGYRSGTNVAIFTTADGVNFTHNLIAVTNMPDSAAGLGIAWGTGSNIWAKSSSFNLRQIGYDISTGTGWVVAAHPIPGPESAIGVDNVNGFAATIGTSESPQNLPIYDVTVAGGASISSIIDREFFPSNNANGNATGAIAVDVAGGRIFALDSNNGILALNYAPRVYVSPTANGAIVTWTGPGVLRAASVVTGPYVDVSISSPYTNTASGAQFYSVRR